MHPVIHGIKSKSELESRKKINKKKVQERIRRHTRTQQRLQAALTGVNRQTEIPDTLSD